MSTTENTIYLENKQEQFAEILAQKRWDLIQPFYIKMEEDGMGQFVSELSQDMTDEEVLEYKHWDRETNGSTETQMDDNS